MRTLVGLKPGHRAAANSAVVVASGTLAAAACMGHGHGGV
jgi:hypothetical protein